MQTLFGRAIPIVACALFVAPTACTSDDDATKKGSFEPAAEDATVFSEPRDAVPLENGAIAFIARATGSLARDPENAGEEGKTANLVDRYAVFVVDAPKSRPRIVYSDLVAPFNIASNGKDLLYVADLAAGEAAMGAIIQVPVAGGTATLLAEGYRPRGVTTDASGKVLFTGADDKTGAPGVFALDGSSARVVVTGGGMVSPSGLDVTDDGTVYVADAMAARTLDDAQVIGSGHGAIFEVKNGATRLITAGFEAGYPTGIAIAAGGKLLVSAYADRGINSAVLVVDPTSSSPPTTLELATPKVADVYVSAGLHRSRATGNMAWSGGNTVFFIQP